MFLIEELQGTKKCASCGKKAPHKGGYEIAFCPIMSKIPRTTKFVLCKKCADEVADFVSKHKGV